MGTAFAHTVDHHAVGAGKCIDKRLNRHSTESNLRIGDDDTCLHTVTDTRHFQTVIDDLQIQLILCDLAAHDLHAFLSGENRENSRGNFKVIDTAVTVRQQGSRNLSAAVIKGTHHVAAALVTEPCIHIVCQKIGLLFLHHIVVFRRNAKRRCHLTMKKLRGAEAVVGANIECAAVLVQTESLRCTDVVLLCRILTLKLSQHFR